MHFLLFQQEKYDSKAIMTTNPSLDQLPTYVAAVQGENAATYLESMRFIRKLLCKEHEPPIQQVRSFCFLVSYKVLHPASQAGQLYDISSLLLTPTLR